MKPRPFGEDKTIKLKLNFNNDFKNLATNFLSSLSIFIQNCISSGLFVLARNLLITNIVFSILLVLNIIEISDLQ